MMKSASSSQIPVSLLTSGGAQSASVGRAMINKMTDILSPEIEVIAAGKITSHNLEALKETLKCSAFHGRCIVPLT